MASGRKKPGIPKKPPLMCDVCKYTTQSTTTMADHVRIHTGERPFVCGICGRAFTQRSNLRQHLIVHGSAPASISQRFSCSLCSFTSHWKQSLTIHMRRHNGVQPYQCELCGQRFSQSTHRNTHMREVHTEHPRRFRCKICAKTYKRLDHLKLHNLCHTGERPYSCGVCKKKFITPYILKVHARIHQGDSTKIHTCKLCHYRTRYAQGLRSHFSRIHGMKYTAAKKEPVLLYNQMMDGENGTKLRRRGRPRKGEASLRKSDAEGVSPKLMFESDSAMMQPSMKRKVGRPRKNHGNLFIETAENADCNTTGVATELCHVEPDLPVAKRTIGRPRKYHRTSTGNTSVANDKEMGAVKKLLDKKSQHDKEQMILSVKKRKIGRPRKYQISTTEMSSATANKEIGDASNVMDQRGLSVNKCKMGRPRKYRSSTSEISSATTANKEIGGARNMMDQRGLCVKKRKIGRPRKHKISTTEISSITANKETGNSSNVMDQRGLFVKKRKIGRPRKHKISTTEISSATANQETGDSSNVMDQRGLSVKKRKIGRPRKYQITMNGSMEDDMPVGDVNYVLDMKAQYKEEGTLSATKRKIGRPRKYHPDIAEDGDIAANMEIAAGDKILDKKSQGEEQMSLSVTKRKIGRPRKYETKTVKDITEKSKHIVTKIASGPKHAQDKSVLVGKRKIGRPQKYNEFWIQGDSMERSQQAKRARKFTSIQNDLKRRIGRPPKKNSKMMEMRRKHCGMVTKRKVGRPRSKKNVNEVLKDGQYTTIGKSTICLARNVGNIQGMMTNPSLENFSNGMQNCGNTVVYDPTITVTRDLGEKTLPSAVQTVLGSLDVQLDTPGYGERCNTSLDMSREGTSDVRQCVAERAKLNRANRRMLKSNISTQQFAIPSQNCDGYIGNTLPEARPMKRGRPKGYSMKHLVVSSKKAKLDKTNEKVCTNSSEREANVSRNYSYKKTKKISKQKRVKENKSNARESCDISLKPVIVYEHIDDPAQDCYYSPSQRPTHHHGSPVITPPVVSNHSTSHRNGNGHSCSPSEKVRDTVTPQDDHCVYDSLRAMAVDFNKLSSLKRESIVKTEVACSYSGAPLAGNVTSELPAAHAEHINEHNSTCHSRQFHTVQSTSYNNSRQPDEASLTNGFPVTRFTEENTGSFAQRTDSFAVDADRTFADISHNHVGKGTYTPLTWYEQRASHTPENCNVVYPLDLSTVRERHFTDGFFTGIPIITSVVGGGDNVI